MNRSKTLHVLAKSHTPEPCLEEKPKWPPLGHRGERKGLSVVGFHRAAAVSRTFSSDGRLHRSNSSVTAVSGCERTVLEDENKRLREELAKYQTEALERHRRPMAAIAGGGFRAAASQRSCMCEVLKAKLARRCRQVLAHVGQSTSMPCPSLQVTHLVPR
ncbi:unnamed protein product [Effrenium voratum]|nr:unnamed protein product [Effrenium voratum]